MTPLRARGRFAGLALRSLGVAGALALAGGVHAEPAASIAPVASLPLTGGTLTGNLSVNKNTGALPAPFSSVVAAQFVAADGAATFIELDNFGGSNGVVSRIAAGTNASPTLITAGTSMTGLSAQGYDGVGYYTAGQVTVLNTNTWSTTDHSTFFRVRCIPSASITIQTCGIIDSGGFEGPVGGLAPNTVAATTLTTSSTVTMSGLPTSDPHVAGRVWSNGGVLTVSAG
jgi:hypothetical protein